MHLIVVAVPVPQIQEQIVEVIKVIPQEQMAERIVVQIVDVPMPQIPEQIVDVPVPKIMEETVEVAKLIPQERVQQRTLEETVNVPVLQIQQQIVAVEKAVPSRGESGRSSRRAQPHRGGAGGCAGVAAASVLRRRGRKLVRHTPRSRSLFGRLLPSLNISLHRLVISTSKSIRASVSDTWAGIRAEGQRRHHVLSWCPLCVLFSSTVLHIAHPPFTVRSKGRDFCVSRLRVCCSVVLSFTPPRSAAFRVFCVASSLYSSLADFCSGERRLLLSLRRRNHLE